MCGPKLEIFMNPPGSGAVSLIPMLIMLIMSFVVLLSFLFKLYLGVSSKKKINFMNGSQYLRMSSLSV